MLTFRVCGREGRYEIAHQGQQLNVHVARREIRRHAEAEVRFRGPESFELAESRIDGATWFRVEHRDGVLLLRAFYAASSTSSRLIVAFDAPREWAIRWIRPESVTAAGPPANTNPENHP